MTRRFGYPTSKYMIDIQKTHPKEKKISPPPQLLQRLTIIIFMKSYSLGVKNQNQNQNPSLKISSYFEKCFFVKHENNVSA